MDDRKVRFRKSVNGYNKEDVNGYIETVNLQFSELEKEYRLKIEELEKKIEELELEASEENSKAEQVIEELRCEKEKSDALIAALNDKLDELKQENDSAVKENSELKEKLTEALKTSDPVEEIYEKSSMYDRVSGQIGSVILGAKAKAKTIISEAEIEARNNANSLINETMAAITAVNEKYTSEIMKKTFALSDELRKLAAEADMFCEQTNDSVELECKALADKICEKKDNGGKCNE